MARIEITIAEIVDILYGLDKIPEEISDIRMIGNEITFSYHKGVKVKSSIKFLEYENGRLQFTLQASWLVGKLLKMYSFSSSEFIDFNYPNLTIRIQDLIEEYLKIIKVEKIHFDNGKIIIDTISMS